MENLIGKTARFLKVGVNGEILEFEGEIDLEKVFVVGGNELPYVRLDVTKYEYNSNPCKAGLGPTWCAREALTIE